MGKIQCKQDQNFLSPMNNINIIIIIIKNTFSNFSSPAPSGYMYLLGTLTTLILGEGT